MAGLRLKAIFFDQDGLLFDTEKIYLEYWKKAAKECGCEIPDELALELRSCDASVGRKIVGKALGAEEAYDAFRAKRKELMTGYFDSHKPDVKPGVRELLEQIETLPDIRKVIVTQSTREKKTQLLENTGLIRYFDDFVAATSLKRGKPYADPYTFACQKLKVDPGECLAYEDSPNGIRSAAAAGVPVIMIPDLTEPDEEMRRLSTKIFRRIDESWQYVEKLAAGNSLLP